MLSNEYDHMGLFRPLTPQEESTFREWARKYSQEAEYRKEEGSLCVVHPVVRDEWRKMGLI